MSFVRSPRRRVAPLAALAAFFALTFAAADVRAMPVAFTDSFMAMTDLSEEAQEASVSYSFARGWAVQAGGLRWTRDHAGVHEDTREIVDLHLNKRAWRLNTPGSQANWYVQAGLGSARAEQSGRDLGRSTVTQFGTQLDWETTRLYAAYKGHRYIARDFNHTSHAVVAGASLYEVDYDQVQPWVVVEAKRISKWSKDTELTLFARFIYRTLFAEVGVNDEGKPRATLMYIWM
jgi:hypothetical protein